MCVCMYDHNLSSKDIALKKVERRALIVETLFVKESKSD